MFYFFDLIVESNLWYVFVTADVKATSFFGNKNSNDRIKHVDFEIF